MGLNLEYRFSMQYKYLFTLILVSFLIPASAEELSPGVLRTPDARFENLKDYPYKPNYMMIDGLRIHYLDEGPKDADPIILFHGEPTWSYLFRKMIPVFTTAGHRVIVPDMVGFGKSDKFISKHDYSYQHHIDVMKELVIRLDLKEATHFGQDWGGLVGLRVVAELPDRFARVVVSNTGMVARGGFSAWLAQNLVKLVVWWHGPITFEELKAASQEALSVENPSESSGAAHLRDIVVRSWLRGPPPGLPGPPGGLAPRLPSETRPEPPRPWARGRVCRTCRRRVNPTPAR